MRKRAKKFNKPEADVLRMGMLTDAMVDGDVDALQIIGRNLAELLAERYESWRERGLLEKMA